MTMIKSNRFSPLHKFSTNSYLTFHNSNTVYIGAPFDAPGGLQTGSVSIYTEVSNNSWVLLDKFTPSDSLDGDRFGVSLDVDDTLTLAVGSNVSLLPQIDLLLLNSNV